jgi:hypothetical protein
MSIDETSKKRNMNIEKNDSSQEFYESKEEANSVIAAHDHFIGQELSFENKNWTIKNFKLIRLEEVFIIKCELYIPPSKHIEIPFEELKLKIS